MTSFTKVHEKIMCQRLLKHINNNNILVNEQFGCRSDYSMEIASYNLENEILKALNNKSKVGGISFDLEKAFDFVNQKISLSKLQFCGITENLYTLIRSYFENRNQRMSLSHKLSQSNISNWGTIKYMVYCKDQYLYRCSFYSVLMTYLKYQTFENLKINLKIILFLDDTSVTMLVI